MVMIPFNAPNQQSSRVTLQLSDLLETPEPQSSIEAQSNEANATEPSQTTTSEIHERTIQDDNPLGGSVRTTTLGRLLERFRFFSTQYQHEQISLHPILAATSTSPPSNHFFNFEADMPFMPSRPMSHHSTLLNHLSVNQDPTIIRREQRLRMFFGHGRTHFRNHDRDRGRGRGSGRGHGHGHGRGLFSHILRRNLTAFDESTDTSTSEGSNDNNRPNNGNTFETSQVGSDGLIQVPPLALTPNELATSRSVSFASQPEVSVGQLVGERLRRENELNSSFGDSTGFSGNEADTSALERYHRNTELSSERMFNNSQDAEEEVSQYPVSSALPRVLSPQSESYSNSADHRRALAPGIYSPSSSDYLGLSSVPLLFSTPFSPPSASARTPNSTTVTRGYSFNDGFFNRTRRLSITGRFRSTRSDGNFVSRATNRLRRSTARLDRGTSPGPARNEYGPIMSELLQLESTTTSTEDQDQEDLVEENEESGAVASWSRKSIRSLKDRIAKDLHKMLGSYDEKKHKAEVPTVEDNDPQEQVQQEQQPQEKSNEGQDLVLDDEMRFETLRISPISSALLDLSNNV